MTDYIHYTDEALCTELPGNNGSAAFSTLYERYSERLYYNILGLVKDELAAEELLQDVFLRLWQKRDNLKIEKGFANYLFTMSRNSVMDFFRKVKRDQKLYARLKAVATEHYTHIEEALLQKENQGILQEAIEQLSPMRKRVFELCKLDGLSYQEVADRLDISLSTVKDHMAKARQGIREYIFSNRDIVIALCLFICLKNL